MKKILALSVLMLACSALFAQRLTGTDWEGEFNDEYLCFSFYSRYVVITSQNSWGRARGTWREDTCTYEVDSGLVMIRYNGITVTGVIEGDEMILRGAFKGWVLKKIK